MIGSTSGGRRDLQWVDRMVAPLHYRRVSSHASRDSCSSMHAVGGTTVVESYSSIEQRPGRTPAIQWRRAPQASRSAPVRAEVGPPGPLGRHQARSAGATRADLRARRAGRSDARPRPRPGCPGRSGGRRAARARSRTPRRSAAESAPRSAASLSSAMRISDAWPR